MTRDWTIDNFKEGLVTKLRDKKSLPRGATIDSLNWLSFGDRIELRRGMARLGANVTGNGKIYGLRVGKRFDGTQVPYIVRSDGKVQSYSSSTGLFSDIFTLPTAAIGEDFAMENYEHLAGAFVYGSSPNSGMYKFPVANPTSYVDLSVTNHRGKIRIKKHSTYLFDRKDTNGGRDQTSLYRSYLDKDELSDFTAVTSEAIGSSGSTTYTGTLAFKAAGSKRSCMYVSIQATVAAGTETFRDDRNGVLVGNLGGTGTINYATGAYSVTFSAVTTGAVTADYYWEDSTSAGIADFSKSGTRTSGQGFVLPQTGGGNFQNLFTINDDEFCFHETNCRKVTIETDDTTLNNKVYRQRVGLPYWLAACETGEGIPYVDTAESSNPQVRILQYDGQSDQVLPASLSDQLDLSSYRFDKAVLVEWGEYYVLACRTVDSTENDTMFIRHKVWKSWDKLDYRASRLDVFNGALIAGDSVSNNVYTLFSGLDEDEVEISNYRISPKLDLGVKNQTKRFYDLLIDGDIGPDQNMKVYLSYDEGPFVEVGVDATHDYAIEGSGSYVDRSQSVAVGALTVGSSELGGGGSDGDVVAYHFRRSIRIASDIFEYVQIKIEGVGIGWLSVNEITFKDIRPKGSRIATKYA